jgi:hypothetical protein
MADLNALIAQGVQFKAPPDPFEQYGRMQQLEQGQQANQLNMMKMDEYRRGLTEQNALRNLDPSAADYLAQVSKINPKLGFEFGELQGKAQTARLTQRETQLKIAAAKEKMLAQAARDISSNPSDAQLTAHYEDIIGSDLFTPAEKQKVAARHQQLLALPYAQRSPQLASQGASSGELKPTTTSINQSGQTSLVQSPAFGGTPTTIGTYADVPLPANVVAQKAKIAAASRAPRAEAAPRTQQVTLSDGSLGIVNMDTGVITPSTVGGKVVKGKPSAFAEKTAGQKEELGKNIDQAIFELGKAIEPKGLIDQSTGSGIGRAYDVSAGLFGQAPEGAIAAGKLAPIADLVLKMVPRFEGPQSDKDTQSYKEAAGQLSNSSLPREIRKAAAKEILRLFKNRKNQFGANDMASEGAAPSTPAVAPPAGFTPD